MAAAELLERIGEQRLYGRGLEDFSAYFIVALSYLLRRRLFRPDSRRIDQNDLFDLKRQIAARHFYNDPATERVAEESHLLRRERLKKFQHEIDIIINAPGLLRLVGQPEAGHVGRDNMIFACEQFGHIFEKLYVRAPAVQQNHKLARAFVHVVYFQRINICLQQKHS